MVWTEARRRGHDLASVVAWMAAPPAAVVGIPRKGRIEVGEDADFAVFAPDEGLALSGVDRRNSPSRKLARSDPGH